MKTKTMKILVFIVTALLMISLLSTAVFAATDPEKLISEMEKHDMSSETGSLTELGGKILSVLQVVGIIVGTVILAVLGLKYMTGSLEEKAEYKKTMIPYLVGAIIIFAAPILARGIFSMISGLSA